jgi:SAM-dependent methyltransferase
LAQWTRNSGCCHGPWRTSLEHSYRGRTRRQGHWDRSRSRDGGGGSASDRPSCIQNTEFGVAFADDLPFPAGVFDAVVSRFGVMFFPSPENAVREMLRVLKPGGKLALAVWHLPERNPFFYILSRIIERYADSPTPAPDAPDTFRFASPGKLRQILGEAGAIAPSERTLQFKIQAAISVENFWTLRCEMSEKLREKIAMLSGEQLAEVKRQSLEALREYSTDRGVSFPAQVLIVSATRALGHS